MLQRLVRAWKKVTDAVHEKGGRIFAQLWHTGAVSHPDHQGGVPPRAPSPVNPNVEVFTATGFQRTVMPREMEWEDIQEVIDNFRTAAVNAMEAGFDGVKIHGANGYLFDQFLRDGSNLRTDEYGGSVENRARFHFEVLDAVTKAIPSNQVGIRLAPSGLVQVAPESNPRETYGYVIERLNDYDLAFLELMESVMFLDEWKAKQEMDDTYVKEVAKHFRSSYKGTLITNGGYTQETGNKIIEEGHADLVSFGNLYIGNPDLVERFAQNAPLNENDKTTYYTGGPKGYVDYPTLEQAPEGLKVGTPNPWYNKQVSEGDHVVLDHKETYGEEEITS
jgi:N-ethylmaleimide reductase